MSEPKYTPGPWAVAPCCSNEHHGEDTHGLRVEGPTAGYSQWLYKKADAHLIAAAPDLDAYAERSVALFQALVDADASGDITEFTILFGDIEDLADEGRAALAQARGEATL